MLVVFIGAPVSPGHAHQLNGLDGASIGNVRPGAEVGEFARLVEGDCAIGQSVNEFEFVEVGFFGEEPDGLCFGDVGADVRKFLPGQFLHFGFHAGKIRLRESGR